jgi:hypothetical protein
MKHRTVQFCMTCVGSQATWKLSYVAVGKNLFQSCILYKLGQDSVVGIATWMVRVSNPGGGEIFHTHPEWSWSPPSHLYSGYRVFLGSKVAGV